MINIITSDFKVKYVFDVIFSIFKTDYSYNLNNPSDLTITYDTRIPVLKGNHIHIKKSSFWENYKQPASLPELPLKFHETLPVIYGEPKVVHENNRIVISIDIIASIFFMITRYEEFLQPHLKDRHSRFPAVESIAYKENFLDRPIVNEYIELLFSCLKNLIPGLKIIKPKFKLWFSHDIDDLYLFKKFPYRMLMGDLLVRRSIPAFFRTLNLFIKSKKNIEHDPYYSMILKFIETEKNFFSIYYFLIGGKTKYDNRYSYNDPYLTEILKIFKEKKIRYGLHSSYDAYNNEDIMRTEKNLFERVTNEPVKNVRNHFLRFDVASTWQIQNKLGFKYDSTCGFADHAGFRCGICNPFKTYDLIEDKPLEIIEIPLTIMDGTLRDYRNFSPDEAVQVIENYKKICKKHNGILNILWHNSFFYYSPSWENVYLSSICNEKKIKKY